MTASWNLCFIFVSILDIVIGLRIREAECPTYVFFFFFIFFRL
jgi:hypothetical protein